MRTRLFGLILGTGLVLHALPLLSANLTVIPGSGDDCSDGEGSFQQCLDVAEGNNEGDTIQVQSANYDLSATLVYAPGASENFPLTIENSSATFPVISSNLSVRCLSLDLSAVTNDSDADLEVRGLIFQRCKDPLEDGGAIQTDSLGADVTISNVTFEENESGEDGGALDINSAPGGDATFSILDSTFTGNKAAFAGAFSMGIGGIKTIEIHGNTLEGNRSLSDQVGGGTVFLDGGTMNISNNLITGNQAVLDAGGLQVATLIGSIVITNNILSDNQAGDGSNPITVAGGLNVSLFDQDSSATITNNTLVGNSALAVGGGLKLSQEFDSNRIDVFNNIIFGNTAPDGGADIFSEENSNNNAGTGTLNLFNNTFAAGGFFSQCLANPPCANVNGADSPTNLLEDPLLVDPANGDFSPSADSPAIDAGDPSAPEMPSSDFLGNPRPSVAGENPDIGAVEFQEATPTPSPSSTPTPDLDGGGCSLSSNKTTHGFSCLGLGLALAAGTYSARRRLSSL